MNISLKEKVLPEFIEWADELAAIRRDVHRTPELGFETPKTVGRIVANLREWGADKIDTESVKGGVIALIQGQRPGRTLALRADIDALPMTDCSDTPWKSQHDGCAHACGHDGHQTWAMGVARYFCTHRGFSGRLVMIFQPAEEVSHGAKAVIASGIFQEYAIEEIYGAHSEPFLDRGTFGFKAGPLQASSDGFWIKVHGVGTHGGRPHKGTDPIPAMAQIVLALQTVVSRKMNPIDTGVLSICSVNAGRYEAFNVIPHILTMSGTVRTYSDATRDLMEQNIRTMVETIANANGCTTEIEYVRQISPVINDAALTNAAVAVATKVFGADHVVSNMEPMMSSEDFSEYQKIVPGLMVRIGLKDENHTTALHNQQFDFNDEVLPSACTLLTSVLLSRFSA